MAGDVSKKLTAYTATNAEAAQVILRDVARYGGNHAALVEWARLYLARHGAATKSRSEAA